MCTQLRFWATSRHLLLATSALVLELTCARAAVAQQALAVVPRSILTQPATAKLTPIRTIGALDGPPEYAFGQLGEIAVDRRGRMYTYDEKDHQLRAYDAAGRFVTKIGRRGAGSGEYQSVVGVAIVADSLVAIHDPSLARITLFEPSGKLHRIISEPRATSWGGASFFGDNAGRVYVRIPVRKPGATEQTDESRAFAGARFLGFDMKGRLVDSIPVVLPQLAAPQPRSFRLLLAEGGHLAFRSSPDVVPAPDGSMIAGTGETMRFTITPRTGAPRVVQQPWTAVALTAAEHKNWEEWATHFSKQGGNFKYDIPTPKPAYMDIKIDLGGRIWVSVFAKAEKRDIPPRAAGDKRPLLVWRQRATYDVYSAAGMLLGRVVMPPLQSLIQATGDQVFAMGKGPDDEQIITVYRLSGLKQ